MNKIFPQAIKFVLSWEGGYSNDSKDPGGETNFGISKRTYPDLDIKNLTKEQAIEIYRRDYWGKAGCDYLQWPMDMIVFDTAVNLGVSAALKLAQKNMIPIDYLFARIKYYAGLKGAAIYLSGWVNRVTALYSEIKGAHKDGMP
jgi:lysozyme family protein